MKPQGIATSNPMQISFVLQVILQLEPSSVLDIGCGSGKYGVLVREYRHRTRIDAIEGFAGYVTDVHRAVYDNVLIGNALDFVPKLGTNYDLALMIDMFEHLSPDDGRRLLQELKPHARHILVSVPVEHAVQEPYDGNELQRHRAQYDVATLRQLGFTQIWRISGNLIALLSPRHIALKRNILKLSVASLLPLWIAARLAPIFRAGAQPTSRRNTA